MQKTMMTVLAFLVLVASANAQDLTGLPASPLDIGIAPYASSGESLAQTGYERRVRSNTRTWAGITMLAAGGVMTAYYGASTCSENRAFGGLVGVRSCGEAATMMGVGMGLAVLGTLYATIWSDVPVTVSPQRGGASISRSVGW